MESQSSSSPSKKKKGIVRLFRRHSTDGPSTPTPPPTVTTTFKGSTPTLAAPTSGADESVSPRRRHSLNPSLTIQTTSSTTNGVSSTITYNNNSPSSRRNLVPPSNSDLTWTSSVDSTKTTPPSSPHPHISRSLSEEYQNITKYSSPTSSQSPTLSPPEQPRPRRHSITLALLRGKSKTPTSPAPDSVSSAPQTLSPTPTPTSHTRRLTLPSSTPTYYRSVSARAMKATLKSTDKTGIWNHLCSKNMPIPSGIVRDISMLQELIQLIEDKQVFVFDDDEVLLYYTLNGVGIQPSKQKVPNTILFTNKRLLKISAEKVTANLLFKELSGVVSEKREFYRACKIHVTYDPKQNKQIPKDSLGVWNWDVCEFYVSCIESVIRYLATLPPPLQIPLDRKSSKSTAPHPQAPPPPIASPASPPEFSTCSLPFPLSHLNLKYLTHFTYVMLVVGSLGWVFHSSWIFQLLVFLGLCAQSMMNQARLYEIQEILFEWKERGHLRKFFQAEKNSNSSSFFHNMLSSRTFYSLSFLFFVLGMMSIVEGLQSSFWLIALVFYELNVQKLVVNIETKIVKTPEKDGLFLLS